MEQSNDEHLCVGHPVFDGVWLAYAIQNGSTGSVVLLNFSVIGEPSEISIINLTYIQLADDDYNVGTTSPHNGTFTVLAASSLAGYVSDNTGNNGRRYGLLHHDDKLKRHADDHDQRKQLIQLYRRGQWRVLRELLKDAILGEYNLPLQSYRVKPKRCIYSFGRRAIWTMTDRRRCRWSGNDEICVRGPDHSWLAIRLESKGLFIDWKGEESDLGWNNATPVVVTFFRDDGDGSGISYTNYSRGFWLTACWLELSKLTISVFVRLGLRF